MISIDNLFVEFSAKPLFAGVSYVINDRDRIALVGKNGAGKSTMLKIIAGLQSPTSGSISSPRETTIGYLPQVMILTDKHTVREEAELAFSHIHEIQKKLDALNRQLAERTDYESEDYMALVERFTQMDERYHMMGGANYQGELERTLTGLGFTQQDFDRPTSEFSGGWRMRIELAKILLQHPDVLLLDEPTNHLDIESIQWLEQFLQNHQGAVVMVSHDRAFINNVTNRTIEISCGQIYDYKVKYDEYVTLRAERREQQLRAYENQQKEIADTKAFIERFRYQATKANQVQSRIKALEKIVPIEIDEVDNSRLRLRFTCSQRSGDFPVICEDVAKAYGTHLPTSPHNGGGASSSSPSQLGGRDLGKGPVPVFSGVNLQLRRGEKVAFVGRNGEGKTTLVKCIMGQIPFDGTLKIGHNVEIGYFAQNQAQLLDEELTVFETIDRVARGDIRLKIRDILGAFMFGGEESDKKVKVLSGGERTRLAMIKLLLEPVNLLILDEPTNHLDMRSKDVLKEAIRDFDGTVILVSHDRDFLDGLVSRVYVFGGGQVREHLGGIYDYLNSGEWRVESGERIGEANCNVKCQKPNVTSLHSPLSTLHQENTLHQEKGRMAFEAQKAQARQRKKLEKAVSEAEQAVSELEQAIAILETKMATPEGGSDMSLYEKHGRLKQQLSKAEDEWAEAMEALEKAEGNS